MPMSTLSFDGLWKVTHSLPLSRPAEFWSKAYIITSEGADGVVANATAVKRSIKTIPNIILWFLIIVTELEVQSRKPASWTIGLVFDHCY